VTRIVPEFAPEGTPSLVVLGDPDAPTVVASSTEGVLVLPLTAASVPLLPALPEGAPRLAEPAVAAAAEQLLALRCTLQQAPQRWLNSGRTRWDLGQFDFASSSRARALKRLATGWAEVLQSPSWRPARWAAVALLAVNVIGLNAAAWKERASFERKREAASQTLRETFPQVRVVVDAPVQMEREVAALRQATGMGSPRDLDAMLGALASALPSGRTPANLQYTAGQLRATGLALGAEDFRRLASQLQSFGYSATTEGDTVVVAEGGR
jgi:general secretion pathway protein L